MTTEELKIIYDLQQQGLGYKKIAAVTGLPVNTVKAHCRRHKVAAPVSVEPDAFCKGCGKPIKRIPNAKPRMYCSDECRMRFWNSHRDEVKHRAIYSFQCPNCGREFQSFGNPNRKFCSRECAAEARQKGGAIDGR